MAQLPEDLIRLQEVIWRVQPDVIVATGVGHGGALVFFASLFAARGHGRVIGVASDLRSADRDAIAGHTLAPRIALIAGGSTAPATLAAVRALLAPRARVLVVLDSAAAPAPLRAELDAYAPLVSPGSYLIVGDALAGLPAGMGEAEDNATQSAITAFLALNPDFVADEPPFPDVARGDPPGTGYCPSCFLRRCASPADGAAA